MMPTMMTLIKLLIVRASPWMHRSAWASSTAAQYPSKVEALTRCWFCRINKEVPCELHDRQEAWGAAGAHRDEAVMRKVRGALRPMRTPETKRGQPRRFLRNSITLALDHRDPEKTTGPPTSDFHYGGSPPPRPQNVGRVYNTQNSITAALDRGLRSTRTQPNSTRHYGSPWPSRPQEAI